MHKFVRVFYFIDVFKCLERLRQICVRRVESRRLSELVLDEHNNLCVAQYRQLVRLFEQPKPPFNEGNEPGSILLYALYLDLTPTHCGVVISI